MAGSAVFPAPSVALSDPAQPQASVRVYCGYMQTSDALVVEVAQLLRCRRELGVPLSELVTGEFPKRGLTLEQEAMLRSL